MKKIVEKYSLAKEIIDTKSFFQLFDTAKESLELMQFLSEEEKARSAKITHPKRKNAFIIAHALSRILLEQEKALKKAPLSFGTYKKPYLNNALFFNISYAKDICAIAISNKEIGIDIAQIEPINPLPLEFLHKDELALLQKSSKIYEDFLYMWTYKEAVAKAIGVGVNFDFSAINSLKKHFCYKNNLLKIKHKSITLNQKKYIVAVATMEELA